MDSCTAANSISIRFYSITSSARAMSFTNGSTLICVNDVARKHKRDVLATPQHVEIKRRVKCLKCEYTFWQQSPRLALDLVEPSVITANNDPLSVRSAIRFQKQANNSSQQPLT
jgi:hypothetical protein